MFPDNVAKKPCRREFLFLASFESNEYLNKSNACFIKNLKFNSDK